MAGYFERDLRRHRRSSRYLVAQMFVHRDQIGAGADGAQVRRLATGVCKMLFGERHQTPSKPPALQRRAQGKQADVAPVAAHFRIDATCKALVVFEQEKPAVAKQRLQLFRVDAVALDCDLLRAKGNVDQRDQRFCVLRPARPFTKCRYCGRAGHRDTQAKIALPGKRAAPPSSSSILSSWLYFAMRSVREAEPVLIWPAPVATARSAIKASSLSPERCEITEVYPLRRARSIASSVSLTVPIWLTLIRIELATALSIPSCRNWTLVTNRSSPTSWILLPTSLVNSDQPSQSFSARPSSMETIG